MRLNRAMDRYLPFDATPREREIATLATSLAHELAASASEHDRLGTFPLAHYARLHDVGYLRLPIPRSQGGDGASLFEMVLAQERLSHAGAALGVGVAMLFNVIGKLLEPNEWPASLSDYVLRSVAEHGGLMNMVVTETELGSISRGGIPATTATPVHGGYEITGHKIFVTAAPALRFLMTAVRIPPDERAPQGYVAYAVVEAPAAGLRLEPTWQGSLSQRSGGSDDAWFERVLVPEDRIVERRAIGSPAPGGGLNGWWMTLVAVYVGIAQAAIDAACDYAHARVPTALGAAIATQPHIQRLIGEMEAELAAARALLYDTARWYTQRPDERGQVGPKLAAAKYAVTHAACNVTERALNVAGGFSLTRRLSLEQHFRDARGGLFQPLQDDLALGMIGRAALAARAP
jgi:alkylation response protein AidB-like acyl-CoA dehydrogenase